MRRPAVRRLSLFQRASAAAPLGGNNTASPAASLSAPRGRTTLVFCPIKRLPRSNRLAGVDESLALTAAPPPHVCAAQLVRGGRAARSKTSPHSARAPVEARDARAVSTPVGTTRPTHSLRRARQRPRRHERPPGICELSAVLVELGTRRHVYPASVVTSTRGITARYLGPTIIHKYLLSGPRLSRSVYRPPER